MFKEPDISVVMSVYNGIPFLEDSIKSILDQSYKNFEFIIIDDASDDGSKEILLKYSYTDSRIVLVFNEKNIGHNGLGHNLAKGVLLARGKYIARMDSDDVAFSERFQIQKKFLEDHSEIDIIGTWAVDIDEKGEHIKSRNNPTDHETIKKLLWTCPLIHPSVMFRKSSILNIGNYSVHSGRNDDYELWFRAAVAGLKFANIPQPLLYYRFFYNFYEKNNLKEILLQSKIGFVGCWKLKMGPMSYLGVLFPLFRALLPGKLKLLFHKFMYKIDPRRKLN